jgi:predicted protein tyrosine phosphatase
MQEIIVKSRREIEDLLLNSEPNSFVISITDPNYKMAKINQEEKNILRLQFYDIDQIIKEEGVILYPISDNQCEQIKYFVEYNFKNIIDLYVHCEAGISRSAGIAAAIAKYYFGDDSKYFKKYLPNKYCYNKLLNKFMEEK